MANLENNVPDKQRTIRGADGQLLPKEQIREELLGEWALKKGQIRDRWPIKAVVEAIYRCKGVWTDIVYALDCTNSQFAQWLESNPQHKEDLARAKVGLIEQAEETLSNLLYSKSERIRLDAARIILSKLGKNLGWSETQNITNVQVNVNDADKTAQIKAVFGIPEKKAKADDVIEVTAEANVNQEVTDKGGSEAPQSK